LTTTTTSSSRPSFAGAYEKELSALADLMDWLWTEHDKSFVKAGDDKVYAFGGGGYIVVVDESMWQGLIELITPKAGVTIKPGDDGKINVSGTDLDEKGVRDTLNDGIEGLQRYYENRYWSTPNPAKPWGGKSE
jgi:hypothetical protein